jgi:phosphatidylserine decarboxylase
MCFLAVGMPEVSTCEMTVYVGQHVNKGDTIGMFHYGGSQKPGKHAQPIPVNARIARLVK